MTSKLLHYALFGSHERNGKSMKRKSKIYIFYTFYNKYKKIMLRTNI